MGGEREIPSGGKSPKPLLFLGYLKTLMHDNTYLEFRDFEGHHWWFVGRRIIFRHLLHHHVLPYLSSAKLKAFDLGCGMGGVLGMLAESSTAFGSDISLKAICYCKIRGFTNVLIANGEQMPFSDNSFDLITAFDTIEHIQDDFKVAVECNRILKPSGRIFVSVPAYQFLYTHQDKVVHHHRRYTINHLCDIFRRAGFTIEQASHINFFLFPLILPIVMLIKFKERLFPPSDEVQSSNISLPTPKWANVVLAKIFGFERHILSRFSVPFGHSIILIASKPPSNI